MRKFKHIVSLGFFCSPSLEFERINRRQFSLPFDWIVTHSLRTVIDLINNQFQDFLVEEYMSQFKNRPAYYKNTKLDIDFYHDFSPFKPLHTQMQAVEEKYQRRIARFYNTVKEPTLFLRYISQQDLPYLLANSKMILKTLQKLNPLNEVIFVANSDCCIPDLGFPIYYVQKDKNDSVARSFLNVNKALETYILENVEAAHPKKTSLKTKFLVFANKLYRKVRLKLKIVYRHNKQH